MKVIYLKIKKMISDTYDSQQLKGNQIIVRVT